jgi:hypothetical protein
VVRIRPSEDTHTWKYVVAQADFLSSIKIDVGLHFCPLLVVGDVSLQLLR